MHHVDNTQLIHFVSGLKVQMPYTPTSIVRLLYGEGTVKEKRVPPFSLAALRSSIRG